jgi:hypothetical protein
MSRPAGRESYTYPTEKRPVLVLITVLLALLVFVATVFGFLIPAIPCLGDGGGSNCGFSNEHRGLVNVMFTAPTAMTLVAGAVGVYRRSVWVVLCTAGPAGFVGFLVPLVILS